MAADCSFVGMRSCVIRIALLAIVLDMDQGWVDGLPAARGQATARRGSDSQPPLALSGKGIATPPATNVIEMSPLHSSGPLDRARLPSWTYRQSACPADGVAHDHCDTAIVRSATLAASKWQSSAVAVIRGGYGRNRQPTASRSSAQRRRTEPRTFQ